MSHGKETPRQKMIGMMYLVFLAMVAINVSGDVMLAFQVIDEGLISTIETIEQSNDRTVAKFEEQYEINKAKVGPWFKKAKEVQERSRHIVEYIQSKKIQIVTESDGEDAEALDEHGNVIAANIEGKDKTAEPYNIMVGEFDNLGGDSLKTMLEDYKHYLLSEVIKENDLNAIKAIESSLKTDDDHGDDHGDNHGDSHGDEHKDDSHGGGHSGGGGLHDSWSVKHFAHLPLSGVITIMSGLQINVLNAESAALRHLFTAIDAGSFKFNKLDATIIPNSSYIIKGNDYTASVFLAASDTNADPRIYFTEGNRLFDSNLVNGEWVYSKASGVNYDTLQIIGGKGRFFRPSSALGEKKWGGIIEMTGPQGDTIRKKFMHSYMVAEGSVVVSPTKMNVFYAGVENPIDVQVAGVRPDNISIQITNAKAKEVGGGSYIVIPRRPGNSIVKVFDKSSGTPKQVDYKDFRVKSVPDPVAKVNNQRGGRIKKNLLLMQYGVVAEMEDFDFDLTFKVISFTVNASVGGFTKNQPSNSNKFTNAQKELMDKLQKGDRLFITDIKAVGPDGDSRPLGTIDFTLN